MLNYFPANCPATLAVTALQDEDGLPGGRRSASDDRPWSGSNYAPDWQTLARTIAAPGPLMKP